MRKRKAGIAVVVTMALCASLAGAGTAFAAGTTTLPESNANWTIPTTPMTNTVWKDADGNVVEEGTEGATQYKVLTTWAEAWSTSGADFLGISNSAYYGNGGNGNATIMDIDTARKDTTAGVWATDANKNPNAYNWNSYYNLYVATEEGLAAGAVASDWTSVGTSNVQGGTANSWSTEAGVWIGFKYRPDVVVTNNNLSESNAITYIGWIQEGKYSADLENGEPKPLDDGTYDQSFYVYGDEDYDPYIMGYNNNSPYSFVASDYELAQAAQDVVDATADEEGLGDNALDWKTVNMLPRSNRYTESTMDCALNVEMLAKGSVYYVLDQIAQGNVEKKKVAYVSYVWNHEASSGGGSGSGGGRGGNSVDGDIQTLDTNTTESQVIVTVFDFTENIGNGPTDGRASFSPVAVDQLGACEGDDLEVATEKSSAGAVNSSDNSTTTYVQYKATADDIASCDVVYCGPDAESTETQWKEWIQTYATTDELKARADDIQYLTDWMCITNGSNFSQEKFMYGSFGLDTIYPELFPNMELSCFWCDNIYHIKAENMQSAMSWIYSTASLPAGVELSNIPATYDKDSVVAKFNEGLDYYVNSETTTGSTDPTIDRILNNVALDGTTVQPDGENPYAFNGFSPTRYWLDTAGEPNVDATELAAAIEAADAITDEESYTEDSWNAFQDAFDNAKEVLENPASTQQDLENATQELLDAIDGLELKPETPDVVKDLLEAAITRAGALNESDYTAESWGAMVEALAAAESVYADEAATQDEVDDATDALNAAIDALEYATSSEPEPTTNVMTVYAGEDRYETADAIAAAVAENGTYDGVIVCSAATGKFADALSASGLSGVLNYPIVLTNGSLDALADDTASAVSALLGGQGDIIVLGGPDTVSDGIYGDLDAYGTVARVSGDDRYATSEAVYEYGAANGAWSTAYAVVAIGNNFPDALGAASFCTTEGAAMLLTNRNSDDFEAYVLSAVSGVDEIVVVGGTTSIPDAKANELGEVTRMDGEDRYDTNIKFAEWQLEHGMNVNGAGIATGTNFPDSLGSSYLLSMTSSVLLLSSPDDNSALYSFLSGHADGVTAISVFGGTDSVSGSVRTDIQNAIGGEWEVVEK